MALTVAVLWASSAVDSQSVRRQNADATRPAITFNRDIAPILFDRCGSCHHPGGVAPFSLLTYASVRQRATQIVDVTRRRFMPPWKADPRDGPFVGQKPLSDDELDLIERWVDGGAVEGDPRDRPDPPEFSVW